MEETVEFLFGNSFFNFRFWKRSAMSLSFS